MARTTYSNNAQTTLAATITSGASSLTVSGYSTFPSSGQFYVLIDSEILIVTAGAGSTSWTVTRGAESTTAAAHTSGATITHVLTAASLADNPRSMTTTGDLEYLNSSGRVTRLAVGGNRTFLTAASGIPAWSTLIAGQGAGDVATNTAFGVSVLAANTVGYGNAGFGNGVLQNFTGALSSHANSGFGSASLAALTTGSSNSAYGYQSMGGATTAVNNVSVGTVSMGAATDAQSNSVCGYHGMLLSNASHTVAVGSHALVSHLSGDYNVGVGSQTLFDATTASRNSTLGYGTGHEITTGSYNVLAGFNAGYYLTTGSYNVLIGGFDGTGYETLSNRILISDGAGTLRISIDNSGNATYNGALHYFGTAAQGQTFINAETLNFAWATSGAATGYINATGYQNGTTQFRNLEIHDGKGAAIITFTGSGKLITLADTANVVLNTGTGTKIGTATGQKLGFWNATPVVQQVLATGGGATVDNVISLLQTLGLCKQS